MAKLNFLQVLILIHSGVESAVVKHELIGGKPCGNNERHHHVWVFQDTPLGKSFCGGTLIDKKWVLTAGHCYNGSVTGSVEVWAGVHPNRAFQKFAINSGDIHVYDVTKNTGDIMLIKLPGSVNVITPAKLPGSSCQTPSNGEKLQVAGHGSTVNPNGTSDLNQPLQCLDLNVTNCPRLYNNYFCGEGLPNNPPAYSCPGDSGGGWLKKRTGLRAVIYGVHAGASTRCDKISLSTSVCAPHIRKWIDDKMSIP
ncbi:trypsin-3-like isoform X1 [Electrophorus electricus]|uniref:Peptidase S1 domain-containing protein n=1 Tax=Electrophorus electricus TaxID=8005 RepID=A0A4W4E0M1_ELEEL|nr:trypsin-3-like isoform X1 [Electrophorus electricus]